MTGSYGWRRARTKSPKQMETWAWTRPAKAQDAAGVPPPHPVKDDKALGASSSAGLL